MEKIIIYLTNLTHVNDNISATESIPLNIGFLAAYTKKVLGDQVEIELFNLYSELKEAFLKKRPHILGASNYSWNSNLSYYCVSFFKKKFPDLITVMGGPSYSYRLKRQKEFLTKRKDIDFYIAGEGETAFTEFVKLCLKHGMNIKNIKGEQIKGCHYLIQDMLISAPLEERIRDLDIIPSPYLEGFLDKFLDKGFTPVVQTNRGCPFSCAYCCESREYYGKINFFSTQRIKEELYYIAKRVKSTTIHIADSNFGMYAQDIECAHTFKDIQDRYGWPLFISAATGKNVKERVAKCVEILGPSINFYTSAQSTNENVLRNINRKNISFEDYCALREKIKVKEVNIYSELILPLPGETLQSHLEGIKRIMSMGIDSINLYTTMLLPASPLYEEENFDRFEMVKKYRVVPRDFGRYDNANVVEVEMVCVGTRDLSLDDYIFLRGFHFIIYCYYNGETFKELIHCLKRVGLEAYDFCCALSSYIDTAPDGVRMIFENFLSDTRKELWDSEEDIYQHYKSGNNFNKLLSQQEGCNLLQKYQGVLFTGYFKMFLEYGFRVARRLLNDKGIDYDEEILQSISSYIINSRERILDIIEEDSVMSLEYDVHTWRQEGFKKSILEYKDKIKFKFSQTEKQKKIIRDYVKIYGNTEDAKGKILNRINPKVLFREISQIN